MQVGDEIKITVLGRKLTYKIYEIETILPEELNDRIKAEEGRDLITLVTCTPYGVNSRRLVLHAEREEAEEKEDDLAETEEKASLNWIIIIIITAVGLGLIIGAGIYYTFRRQKEADEAAEIIRGIIVAILASKNTGNSARKRRKKAKKKKRRKK